MTCSLCAAVGIAAIYIALAHRDQGKCGGSCAEKLMCEDGVNPDAFGFDFDSSMYAQSCKLWHDIVNAWEQSSRNNRGALNNPGKFAGREFPDWFTFASTMYRGGSPEANIGEEPIEEATVEGERFSDDYLLHENMGEGIKLSELASEATFYGNYPSPDNLDGEVIDAAATYNGAKVEAPSRLTGECVRNSLYSVDEIHNLQDERNNRTTANILGEKVLSDHMPTFFDITFGKLSFTGMEYNMLAMFNIPNGYYNSKPPRRTHLWHFIQNIADAWEPKRLKDVNTEWHAELKAGNLLGHVYAQVWALRKRASEAGFWAQAVANRFVVDSVRQKALWKILIDCQKSDPLPDVIFFVEFGLLNFRKREERLKPLIDLGYTVVVASARRHGKYRRIEWADSALILVKKDILAEEVEVFPLWSDDVACDDIVCDNMKCVPGECVLSRELSGLEQVSKRNRGKPMAGVKLKLEKDGIAEEGILFVLHAEKRSTEFVVKRIVEEVKKYKGPGGDLSKLPLVIAGDLNGVLRNRGQEKIVSFMETLQGSLTTTGQYANRSYTIERLDAPAGAKEHGLSTEMAISVKKNGRAIANGVIDEEHCSVNPLCCFSGAVRHSCRPPYTRRLCIIEVDICADGDRVLITESRYTGPNTWERVHVKESTSYDVQKM